MASALAMTFVVLLFPSTPPLPTPVAVVKVTLPPFAFNDPEVPNAMLYSPLVVSIRSVASARLIAWLTVIVPVLLPPI